MITIRWQKLLLKVAIIFSEGIKQINFTPENDDERQALHLITPNDDIQLAVKTGNVLPH